MPSSGEPLVSILINNYNYGRFLGEAIDSALTQTYNNVEVIVVDDGSTDNSREVMESFGPRIIHICKANGGQASAFNAGFAVCTGEIVCLLDSDDIFMRTKVEHVVEIFQRESRIGWCFDTARWFDSATGHTIPFPNISMYRKENGIRGIIDVREIVLRGKCPSLNTSTSGLSFRREILGWILPMPEAIRITSDNYIKYASMAISAGWMDETTITYQRIHNNNAYTRPRQNIRRTHGEVGLLTGMYLQRNGVAERLGFKIFCRGVARLLVAGGVDANLNRQRDSHLRSMSRFMRDEAVIRVLAWAAIERLWKR